MKNNCQFITAKFCRYDRFSDCNQNCYRIITNKYVCFFYEHQFNNITVLDELKDGDNIHIGSHALDDGTFWLHWLVSCKGDLAIRDKLHYSIPHRYTLILPFLILIGFWLNLEIITLILINWLFFIVGWCICATLFRLINLFLPKQSFLRNQYKGLKRGYIGFTPISVFEQRKALCCPQTNLPVYDGIANNVKSFYGKNRQEITFDFNGVRLSLMEYVYSLTNCFIPVIYYSTHPTFIVSGDELSLIFENNKIQGIVNHSDGSSYLFCRCIWMSKRKAKIVLRYLYSFSISTSLLSIILFPLFISNFSLSVFLLIALVFQIFPLFFLLFYTLFSLLNDRSYTKLVLNWLYQTTGHWPKEI